MTDHKGSKEFAQAAIEYLTTYGWAILIIAIMISFLYAFVFAPSFVVPQKCSLTSGAYCNDVVFGTSQGASRLVMLLSNTQQYPFSAPSVIVSVPESGNVSGSCYPSYVLPGGVMVCNVTIPTGYAQGALVSGSMYLNGRSCVSGAEECAEAPYQTYAGTVVLHAQPLLRIVTAKSCNCYRHSG